IIGTWRNWAVCIGLMMGIVLLSPVIERRLMPMVAAGVAGFLAIFVYKRRHRINQALAIPYITMLTLGISALLFLGMNLTASITDVYEFANKPVNHDLPFIVQLILAPVATIVSGIFLLRRLGNHRFFRSHNGRSDVSHVQRIVWQEARYHVKLLFFLSLLLTVTEWCYCYFYFITANLNRPDMFFFVWLPVSLYVLSIVMCGIHCMSLSAFYGQSDVAKLIGTSRTTILRYLLVDADKMYLTRNVIKVKHGEAIYFDTPVRAVRPYMETVTEGEARAIFAENSGITGDYMIKFLFDGLGFSDDNSILHYLCVPASKEEVSDSRIEGGVWLSVDEVRELNRIHMLSAELSAELVHIYTVANAWKRYDMNGKRLYSIKNYRPMLKLAEMKDWTVDFNDPVWLRVARLNADKPLFRLRRFFSRIFSLAI
ncbi:MAG: hypothetical protein K2J07_01195, partial [Muribaculaceae bacterium]|nr:hypothetical protein [Muribaculaceae bacterium]